MEKQEVWHQHTAETRSNEQKQIKINMIAPSDIDTIKRYHVRFPTSAQSGKPVIWNIGQKRILCVENRLPLTKWNDEDSNEYLLPYRKGVAYIVLGHSLYTNNKVFLHELLCNTSDALEELRHIQAANHQGADGSNTAIDLDSPFDIHVKTNEVNGTLSI